MVLQPAIPIIDYIVNKDYISNNLCVDKDVPMSTCNGKCHLVKQLVDLSTANNEQAPTQDNRKYFDYGVHLIVNNPLLDITNSNYSKAEFHFIDNLFCNTRTIPTPPPKLIFS